MKSKSLRQFFIQPTYRAVLVSAICLLLCSSVLMASISRANLHQQLRNLAVQKSQSAETMMTTATEAVRNIAYNETLQRLIASYNSGEFSDLISAKIKINHELENLSHSFAHADNIVVYATDGNMIGNKYEADSYLLEHSEDLLNRVREQGNFYWDMEWKNTGKSVYPRSIMMVDIRASVSYGDCRLNDVLGYLLVQYNFDSFKQLLDTEQDDYKIYLVNKTGNLLSSSNPDIPAGSCLSGSPVFPGTVEKMKFDNRSVYMTVEKIGVPAAQLYCVCTVPQVKIFEDVYIALLSILLLSIFIMFSAYFVIRRRSARICTTIDRMNDSFALIEEGKLELERIPETGILEIDNLTYSFSHMADRLEQLMHELYEAELHKQALLSDRVEAELLALRTQLNPHFLYNTLDTINWTALAHQDYEVSDMILMLGKLFRSNLFISSTETTVRMELERLELFMKIEQYRFGEQLQCETDVDESLMEEPIPGLLLQLLTENSINHGLDVSDGRGQVRITICSEGERMCITVADNGHGMSEETAVDLRNTWTQMQKETHLTRDQSSHIGLRNIMKRLCLLYGTQASFTLKTDCNGTSISVSYPKKHVKQ